MAYKGSRGKRRPAHTLAIGASVTLLPTNNQPAAPGKVVGLHKNGYYVVEVANASEPNFGPGDECAVDFNLNYLP